VAALAGAAVDGAGSCVGDGGGEGSPAHPAVRARPAGSCTASEAGEEARGRAFSVEYADETSTLTTLTDLEAQAMVGRHAYVTRFYTRLTPEAMTLDPEFDFPGGADVSNFHVIDITPPMTSALSAPSDARFAAAPIVLGLLGLVGHAWGLRRRHQKRREA